MVTIAHRPERTEVTAVRGPDRPAVTAGRPGRGTEHRAFSARLVSMNPANAEPHVVIVGGGISGLAAAFFLRDEAVRVTVLEGSPRLGGKLSVSEIAGVAVDEGAEALLVTRPEGTGLIADAGLAADRMSPGTTSSAIWTLGALRPLPRRQFMGVPSDLAELARTGVVSPPGVTRAAEDLERPATARDGDVSVADFVGGRLGAEVVDRLP